MSRLSDLVKAYGNYLPSPQARDRPNQRVIMCVYDEQDELKIRAIRKSLH